MKSLCTKLIESLAMLSFFYQMSRTSSGGTDEDDRGEACFSDSLPPGGIGYCAFNLPFPLVLNHLSFVLFSCFREVPSWLSAD